MGRHRPGIVPGEPSDLRSRAQCRDPNRRGRESHGRSIEQPARLPETAGVPSLQPRREGRSPGIRGRPSKLEESHRLPSEPVPTLFLSEPPSQLQSPTTASA